MMLDNPPQCHPRRSNYTLHIANWLIKQEEQHSLAVGSSCKIHFHPQHCCVGLLYVVFYLKHTL